MSGPAELSRWQVTGLAISLVWAVASAFYLHSGHLERAGEASYSTNRLCLSDERSRLPPDAFLPKEAFTKCSKEAQETHDAGMKGKWMSVALVALAPAIAWLLVYGLSGLIRRRRGG
jgi:hypothetical protein